jgi:hypothetical protein
MATYNFNSNNVTAPVFNPVPQGMYNARIVNSAMRPTQSGNGEYLEFWLKITDGSQSGRLLPDRFNVKNPNQKTEDWAKHKLSFLSKALGRETFENTEELHDQPLRIVVECRQRKDGLGLENVITRYLPPQQALTAEEIALQPPTILMRPMPPPTAAPLPRVPVSTPQTPQAPPVVPLPRVPVNQSTPKAAPLPQASAAPPTQLNTLLSQDSFVL